MIERLIEVLFWTWITFAVLDVVGGLLSFVELQVQEDESSRRQAKIMLAGAQRSLITCIGLALFGINVKAHWLFLCWGCFGVIYKGYATWGWLLYWRGNFRNGGYWSLLKTLFKRKSKSAPKEEDAS